MEKKEILEVIMDVVLFGGTVHDDQLQDVRRYLESQQSKPSQSMEEIRNKFFEECTIEKEGLRVVNMTPHNILEWFAQQSTPTVMDEWKYVEKNEFPNCWEAGEYDGRRSDIVVAQDNTGLLHVARMYRGFMDGSEFKDWYDSDDVDFGNAMIVRWKEIDA